MPVIDVCCIREIMSKGERSRLRAGLKRLIASIAALGLRPDQITVRFPEDRPDREVKEVIVNVWGLFEKPERTPEVKARLAEVIGEQIEQFFPMALVEVFVQPYDPRTVFWTNRPS